MSTAVMRGSIAGAYGYSNMIPKKEVKFMSLIINRAPQTVLGGKEEEQQVMSSVWATAVLTAHSKVLMARKSRYTMIGAKAAMDCWLNEIRRNQQDAEDMFIKATGDSQSPDIAMWILEDR